MKQAPWWFLCVAAAVVGAPAAEGAEFYVYPKDGQSAEQQKQDEFQCYEWAKGQTGFDPMAPPTPTTAAPSEEPKKGGLFRGAAAGAALGAVIGAIAGDPGTGAAIGAAGGGMMGGMRRSDQVRQQEAAQENWEREQSARYQNQRNEYNRAYGVCLEARGYSVK